MATAIATSPTNMAASAAAIAKSGSSRTVRSRATPARVVTARLVEAAQDRRCSALQLRLLGAIVVRTSAVDALVRKRPHAAAWVSPGDPRVDLRAGEGRVSARNRAMSARRAARPRSPRCANIRWRPTLLLRRPRGTDPQRRRQGRDAAGRGARRNPRARTSRLLLLDRYLRTGQGRSRPRARSSSCRA